MKNEIWKDINGYEGHYQVSNLGRIKSIKFNKEKMLKPFLTHLKYHRVKLNKNNKAYNYFVHRLVANNFLPALDKTLEINHKDKFRTNNHLSNLEWVTHKENMKHKKSYVKVDNSRYFVDYLYTLIPL